MSHRQNLAKLAYKQSLISTHARPGFRGNLTFARNFHRCFLKQNNTKYFYDENFEVPRSTAVDSLSIVQRVCSCAHRVHIINKINNSETFLSDNETQTHTDGQKL